MMPFNINQEENNIFNNNIVYSIILEAFISYVYGKKIPINKLIKAIDKETENLTITQLQVIAQKIIKIVEDLNDLNNIKEEIIKEDDKYIIFTSNNPFLFLITQFYFILEDNIFRDNIFRNLILFLIMGGKFLIIYDKKNNTFLEIRTMFKIDNDNNIVLLKKIFKNKKNKIKNSYIFPEYKIFLNLKYNKNTIIKNKDMLFFFEALYNLYPFTYLAKLINLKNGKIYIKNNFNVDIEEIYNKLYFLIYALIKINSFFINENVIDLDIENIAIIIEDLFYLNKNYDFEKLKNIIYDLRFKCFYCGNSFSNINSIICLKCDKSISKAISNNKNIINFINNENNDR